ncbi:MAG: sulfotransferase domain-containing protein [Xanthobacteraceae bacterium]|jgi:hypothetical protein
MDRHFVSFPKSGRSWLRYALTQLGVADKIFFHHDGFEYNDRARLPLDFNYVARFEKYNQRNRVVYLYRDPRDVMVSFFYQITGRFADIFNFDGTISEFIRDPYFGAENLQRFRCLWAALCKTGCALAISYESCHADFQFVLSTVVRHYGLDVNENDIAAAAKLSTYEHMKRVEDSGEFGHPWLQRRNGKPKLRRGRIGDFTEEFTAADIDYLTSIFGTAPLASAKWNNSR